MKKRRQKDSLTPLEDSIMQIVWADQPVTAEDVRLKLHADRQLKDSTIRTLLRRLEEKGYVEHEVEGRTFVYRARREQTNVAADAVRNIVDRFCSGSLENLLIGLVDDQLISSERLKQLAAQIAAAEAKQAKGRGRS